MEVRKHLNAKYSENLKAIHERWQSNNPGKSPYWNLGTFKKHWADVLTCIAYLMIAILIFLCVTTRLLQAEKHNSIQSLYRAVAVFAFWTPLRLYSDWHGNFGATVGQAETVIVSLIAISLLVILTMSTKPGTETYGLFKATSITFLFSVIGGLAAIETEWMVSAGLYLLTISTTLLVVTYGLAGIGFIAHFLNPSRDLPRLKN